MLYTDEFVRELRNDPIGGLLSAIKQVKESMDPDSQEWSSTDHDVLSEAYALVCEMSASGLLEMGVPDIQLTGQLGNDCIRLNEYIRGLEGYCISEHTRLRFQSMRQRFKNTIGNAFHYEFSQGDVERIQALINQLRGLIAESSGLEKDHQRRLLQRLERLQSEVHKQVSDLDRFWGLVGDAGVVLGKIGNDAKPIVDRIRELADIVWSTQTRAEELPSGTSLPMLSDRITS